MTEKGLSMDEFRRELDPQEFQHRWVLHCDMDAFFSSVEQLTRPTLRGRPVLVGGRSGRGVVAGASYEAREFGCHSAMPMHQAKRLIEPRGVVVPSRGIVYRAVSRRIFRILRRFNSTVEQLSVDEAFMEPAELIDATIGEVVEYCEKIREAVLEETGLTVSFGAGVGKQYAKIASDLAKPDGVFVIPQSQMSHILDPLPVRTLWGVGPVAEAKLAEEDILTVADLAQLSDRDTARILGKTVGFQLRDLARGIDERPVEERAIAKQISSESTYSVDITDRKTILQAIDNNADDAHRRLLHDGRAARTVTVKLKLADMSIISRSGTLPYATTDLRTLLAVAHRLALDPEDIGACRLVGVGFSSLTHIRQESLFPELDWEMLVEEERETGQEFLETSGQGLYGSERTRLHLKKDSKWLPGMDVHHPEYGHGWVQGAGRGKVTVRFETRSTGPGRSRTFSEDEEMRHADPLDSLDWPADEIDVKD
ncbi:MAG: DNA polymerase IV [Lawsonella sp.]